MDGLIEALPLGSLVDAVIGVVVAAVGLALRSYLGEKRAAVAVELLNDVAPRAAKYAKRKLGVNDGLPVPEGLRAELREIGADYVERTRPDLVRKLGVTPTNRGALADRIALEM